MINEHDITKKMMDVMRNGLITESNDGDGTISPGPNDPIFKDEDKKISEAVDTGIKITKLKIYPRDSNAELEGRLPSGINFFMSLKAESLSISITDEQGQASRIFMNRELMEVIKRLIGHYENWKREWNIKIKTEYQNK